MAEEDSSGEVFDVAVIGAGVVGCAVARRFTLNGARVVVLEKAADILDGASKGNSAILHTGFDAPPGSLERRCMADGYAEYLEIKDRLNLPVLETDAMVVAWTDADVRRLDALRAQAADNGVSVTPRLSHAAQAAFLIPGEHIVDPWTTPHAYLLQAIENGAELKRGAAVTRASDEGECWRLETMRGDVRARWVVNCAGLYGDHVDALLFGAPSFEIRPRKGQFVVFDKPAADLLTTTVLPVPSATTKGVVLCRRYGDLCRHSACDGRKRLSHRPARGPARDHLGRRSIHGADQRAGLGQACFRAV